jgi:hypothetical protein
MNRKIPSDAFECYVSLGAGRSYQAVAEKYGVSKRGVALHAKRENWQARLAEHERRERDEADHRVLAECSRCAEENYSRYRKQRLQRLATIESFPVRCGSEAAAAVCLGMAMERLARLGTVREEERLEVALAELVEAGS